MKFAINQIYGPNFDLKVNTPKDVLVSHQQQDQRSGIEQKKATIKKRKRATMQRIQKNITMAGIINMAKKNITEGKIIKVGV